MTLFLPNMPKDPTVTRSFRGKEKIKFKANMPDYVLQRVHRGMEHSQKLVSAKGVEPSKWKIRKVADENEKQRQVPVHWHKRAHKSRTQGWMGRKDKWYQDHMLYTSSKHLSLCSSVHWELTPC